MTNTNKKKSLYAGLFAEYLKKELRASGLKQAVFAAQIGLTQSVLARILGGSGLSLFLMEDIATKLDVPLWQIFKGDLENTSPVEVVAQPPASETQELLKVYKKNIELQEDVIAHLRAENARLKTLLGNVEERVEEGGVPPAQTQSAFGGATKN